MTVHARARSIGVLTLLALAASCSKPEVYGHHDLVLMVSYGGAEQEFRLPFRCEEDGSDGIAGGAPSSMPSPYLYHALPDGSGFAIGTPRICKLRDLEGSIADTAAKVAAPYSGDILVPPVAWLDNLERPSVVVHWASASAMNTSSTGFVVRSASVEPRSGPGHPIEDRIAGWSRTPMLLRRDLTNDHACGVAFGISQGPKPEGMSPSDTPGVQVSAERRSFMLDQNFGTGGVAYSAAEFNNRAPVSNEMDGHRTMRARASNVHPLTFNRQDGWTLTPSAGLVGRYVVYRLEPKDAKRHQTFSFKGHSLPLTQSRQIWIERDQTLLTPIGYCSHWIADS